MSIVSCGCGRIFCCCDRQATGCQSLSWTFQPLSTKASIHHLVKPRLSRKASTQCVGKPRTRLMNPEPLSGEALKIKRSKRMLENMDSSQANPVVFHIMWDSRLVLCGVPRTPQKYLRLNMNAMVQNSNILRNFQSPGSNKFLILHTTWRQE